MDALVTTKWMKYILFSLTYAEWNKIYIYIHLQLNIEKSKNILIYLLKFSGTLTYLRYSAMCYIYKNKEYIVPPLPGYKVQLLNADQKYAYEIVSLSRDNWLW